MALIKGFLYRNGLWLIIVIMIISGLFFTHLYYRSYKEVLGDRMAREYYSAINFYNGGYSDFYKKLENDDFEDRAEYDKYRAEIYESGKTINDVLRIYNSTRLFENHEIDTGHNSFLYHKQDYFGEGLPLYYDRNKEESELINWDEDMLNISNRVSLYVYYRDFALEIEETVKRHYPDLSAAKSNEYEIVDKGDNLWKDRRWKNVIRELNEETEGYWGEDLHSHDLENFKIFVNNDEDESERSDNDE